MKECLGAVCVCVCVFGGRGGGARRGGRGEVIWESGIVSPIIF